LDLDLLLDRCRLGDELAWEALVRRYQGRVFAVALHYTRHREEARDTAQEVFVRLYRRLDTVRDSATFLPWLIRLTRNLAIDHLRRLRVRTPETEVAIDQAPEQAAAGPSPEDGSLADDRVGLLHRALARLGAASREIILLKDIQELTLAEIASMLELPLGTVKSRSHRARLELAEAVRALDPSYGA
jgi:RNA polymerase sigma-70 factor (ECF subfamily)